MFISQKFYGYYDKVIGSFNQWISKDWNRTYGIQPFLITFFVKFPVCLFCFRLNFYIDFYACEIRRNTGLISIPANKYMLKANYENTRKR